METLNKIGQLWFLLLLVLLINGCANQASIGNTNSGDTVYAENPSGPSVVSYQQYSDPLEPMNRAIFAFNDVTFRYALGPLATGYKKITPDPVERGIGNLFNNLTEPFNTLNSLFQGKFEQSGRSLIRFLVNSTVGIVGIFDVADAAWHMQEEPNSFADTFTYYGAGYGTYIVLPFLGPSDLRSGTSSVLEFVLHPTNKIDDPNIRYSVQFFNYFQQRTDTLSEYSGVVDSVDDPYLFTRNLYLQGIMRDAEQVIPVPKNPEPTPPPEHTPPPEPTPPPETTPPFE